MWDSSVIIALLGAIPATLLALATLISVLKGNSKLDLLHGVVDGKLSEMIAAVKEASEMKGKVDALAQQVKPQTTIIEDRRIKGTTVGSD